MDFSCGVCGETERVNAICHHCGKPLCQNKSCQIVIRDEAFLGKNQKFRPTIEAVHCPDCVSLFHPAAQSGLGKLFRFLRLWFRHRVRRFRAIFRKNELDSIV